MTDESEYAFKWVADAGVKWQPTVLNGERKWSRRTGLVGRVEIKYVWTTAEDAYRNDTPDLYKSRRRAERVGHREQKRRDRIAANEYREAEEDSD